MLLRAELVFALGSLFIVGYLALFIDLNRLEDLQTFHNFSLLAFVPIGEDIHAWYLYPLQVVSVFELIYWFALVKGMQALIGKSMGEMFGLVGRSYGVGLCDLGNVDCFSQTQYRPYETQTKIPNSYFDS